MEHNIEHIHIIGHIHIMEHIHSFIYTACLHNDAVFETNGDEGDLPVLSKFSMKEIWISLGFSRRIVDTNYAKHATHEFDLRGWRGSETGCN